MSLFLPLLGGVRVVRGMNVMHAWTPAMEVSGGSSFGRLNRVRLISNTKINSVQVVYATFWQAGSSGTGLFDQELATPLNFQAALEYPYTTARTAIPTSRPNFTFSGSNTFAYGGTGSNPSGYIASDVMKPAGGIPANTNFGIWSSVEALTTQPLTYAITALSSSGTTATATMADTTGLYVNQIFNVSGASVAGYNNQTAQGGILSVTPTTVTYKTASSNLAAATTATGIPYFLPNNVSASSAVERFEGTTAAASSAASFVATNAVSNNTSVSNYTTTSTGQVNGFLPSLLLIDYASGDKVVFILGDSVEYAVNAGSATNVAARDGDSMGQPSHATSWVDQGVFTNNTTNFVNGGKGSDGAKFLRDSTVWPLRRNIMSLANPTHVINAMAFNDQGLSPDAGAWVSGGQYYRGQVATKGGNTYLQLNGTSSSKITVGTVGPVGTTVGVYETDGGGSWAYIGASTFNGAQGIGWNMVLNDQIKTLFPSAKIYNTTMMPSASYTTLITLADQTVTAASAGQRNNFNSYMKARQDLMGWASVFDPNTYFENDPIGGDSKWIVDNSTANLVSFGSHPNGYGNLLGSQAIPASSFT